MSEDTLTALTAGKKMDGSDTGSIVKTGVALIAPNVQETIMHKMREREIAEQQKMAVEQIQCRSCYFADKLIRMLTHHVFPHSRVADYDNLTRDELLSLEQKATKIALADRWWRFNISKAEQYEFRQYLGYRRFLMEHLGNDWFPERQVRERIVASVQNIYPYEWARWNE